MLNLAVYLLAIAAGFIVGAISASKFEKSHTAKEEDRIRTLEGERDQARQDRAAIQQLADDLQAANSNLRNQLTSLFGDIRRHLQESSYLVVDQSGPCTIDADEAKFIQPTKPNTQFVEHPALRSGGTKPTNVGD